MTKNNIFVFFLEKIIFFLKKKKKKNFFFEKFPKMFIFYFFFEKITKMFFFIIFFEKFVFFWFYFYFWKITTKKIHLFIEKYKNAFFFLFVLCLYFFLNVFKDYRKWHSKRYILISRFEKVDGREPHYISALHRTQWCSAYGAFVTFLGFWWYA